MRQVITRVDDELAEALKQRAKQSGESVNAFMNRLLRAAVAGTAPAPGSDRHVWKAAALATGRLAQREPSGARWRAEPRQDVAIPAGYAAGVVSEERDER